MAQPTPVVALAVSGMNDVLNSQGYTQAAWWNRIPIAAWGLMAAIAICCNLLIGYGCVALKPKAILLLVLPLVVSISFFLIADIDSPRGGIIHVAPQNLLSLAQSLPRQSSRHWDSCVQGAGRRLLVWQIWWRCITRETQRCRRRLLQPLSTCLRIGPGTGACLLSVTRRMTGGR